MKRNEFVKNVVLLIAGLFFSIYINTRKMFLTTNNPFYFKGKAAEGIGGPHAGMDIIWPLSIIMRMRGLTSKDDAEIKKCIAMLEKHMVVLALCMRLFARAMQPILPVNVLLGPILFLVNCCGSCARQSHICWDNCLSK